MKRILKTCENNPVIVVDRDPWYPYELKRLGLEYIHEKFGERNRIERLFREIKKRTKRFYNNIYTNRVKSVEAIERSIAILYIISIQNKN